MRVFSIIIILLTVSFSLKAQHAVSITLGQIKAMETSIYEKGGRIGIGYSYRFKRGLFASLAFNYEVLNQSTEYNVFFDPVMVAIHGEKEMFQREQLWGDLSSAETLHSNIAIKPTIGYRFFQNFFLQPGVELGGMLNKTYRRLIGVAINSYSIGYTLKEVEDFHLGAFASLSLRIKLGKKHAITSAYNYSYYPKIPAGHSTQELVVKGIDVGYQFRF